MIDFNNIQFTESQLENGDREINAQLFVRCVVTLDEVAVRDWGTSVIEEAKALLRNQIYNAIYGEIGEARRDLYRAVMNACESGSRFHEIQKAFADFSEVIKP